MKTTFNSAVIIAITSLFILSSSSYCSKPEDKLKNKEEMKTENIVKEEAKKENKTIAEPQDVKYIWKDMPSYDRYGNEITPRARENMLKNSMLLKNKTNSTVKGEVK